TLPVSLRLLLSPSCMPRLLLPGAVAVEAPPLGLCTGTLVRDGRRQHGTGGHVLPPPATTCTADRPSSFRRPSIATEEPPLHQRCISHFLDSGISHLEVQAVRG